MKNYEEMARLVLEARDEYVKKKRKRITFVKKVSASLCGAAAVVGIGIFTDVLKTPFSPEHQDPDIINKTTTFTAIPDDASAPEEDNTTAPATVQTSVQTSVHTAVTTALNRNTVQASTKARHIARDSVTTAAPASAVPSAVLPNETVQSATMAPQQSKTTTAAILPVELPEKLSDETIKEQLSTLTLSDSRVAQLCYTKLNSADVDKKLDTILVGIYDKATGKIQTVTAEVFSITGEDGLDKVAVRYAGSSELYLYRFYAVKDTPEDAVISGTPNTDKLKDYIPIDESHSHSKWVGYLSDSFTFIGAYFSNEDYYSEGDFTTIKAVRSEDYLHIKLTDGTTTEEVENALAAFDEISDIDYSGYSLVPIPEGHQGFLYQFAADLIEPSAARDLCVYLKDQGLISETMLYYDHVLEKHTQIYYPFHYTAPTKEKRDQLVEEMKAAFPEYEITYPDQTEIRDTVFYVSDPNAKNSEDKLTMEETINETLGVHPATHLLPGKASTAYIIDVLNNYNDDQN